MHIAQAVRCLSLLCLCTCLQALTSCGLGGAAAASAVNDDSGGNANAVVSDLEAPRSATSPASIFFVLTDQEGDTADVSILFSAGGDSFQPISLDPGSNPLTGVPSNLGVPYEVLWNFGADLGGESYQNDIRIQLVHAGISPPILGGVEMGNDPPQVTIVDYPLANEDTVGDAKIVFTIRDSAADRVKIKVEYNADAENGFPEDCWQRARRAGLAGDTPEFAFEDLPTSAAGVSVTFLWESDSVADSVKFPQLDGKDSDVLVRFSPEDEFDGGVTVPTGQFHIDNNEVPFAILDEGNFLLNPDQRRGIPVPFNVLDEESDPIRVVLQWRRKGEDFPPIPGTVAELLELIDDPARDGDRKLAQIGRQFAQDFTGRVGFVTAPVESPVDPLTPRVRLPELGGSAAELLARGIAGETLEILRPGIPAEVSWSGASPVAAIAAVAREDGLTALVLEPHSGGWRVREIDLTTGNAEPFASGPGAPRAMTVDPLRQTLFVASDEKVFRFDYISGLRKGSVFHSFVDGPRGLAALGEDLLVATGDDALVSINFTPEVELQPLTQLLDGLDLPWGLVVDPLRTNGLYLAERGADRVLSLDLDKGVPVPVAAKVRLKDVSTLGTHPFPNPRALALEQGGHRLLVMSKWAGTASLRGLNLRSPFNLNGDPGGVADPFVFEITDQLGQQGANLATGPDQLRIVCLSNALALGGGVQQRRSIVGEPAGPDDPEPYDPRTQVVALETAFDPPLSGVVNWRIRSRLEGTDSSPTGERGLFLWDSDEVLGGGEVQVRILPLDADVGIVGPVTGFKQVRWGLDVPPSTLDDPSITAPWSVTIGDLDGDGDLDLVSANELSNNLTIFFQTSPGRFVLDPNGPLTGSNSLLGPRSVAIGDLNGDGAMDLVSANYESDNLTIFFQGNPGQFELDPNGPLEDPGLLDGPTSITIGDLNGDGALDLVSANEISHNLTIFFQDLEKRGTFEVDAGGPLGGPGVMRNPFSVAIGDLDGDDDLDVVSANEGGEDFPGNLTIFFQTSPGQFTFDPSGPLQDPDGLGRIKGPVSVAVGDLDGDGDMDLISANQDSNNLTIFFQTSTGQFTFDPDGPLAEPSLDWPSSVALFDLDTDGDLDLVSANLGDDDEVGNITIFFQTSPGQFTANPSGPLTDPSIDSPRSVVIADLDGDGGPDLVSANFDSHNLSVFLAAGLGQYTVDGNDPLGDLGIMESPWGPITGDFDGDGDLDIATAGRLSHNIAIFFQTSPGQFTLSPDGPLTDRNMNIDTPNALATGDLDGDGDLDLVSSNAFSHNLTIFFQDDESPGRFTTDALVLEDHIDRPRDVGIGDLNGDGLLDLVTASRNSNSLIIFFQDPENPGQFVVDPESPLEGPEEWIEHPLSVAIGDLDGDGDLDLVSANQSSDTLTIFFQTSPGKFEIDPGGPLTHGSINSPWSVAIGDLDGDGDLDLVSANDLSNNLTIFFQTNPGQFTMDPRGPLKDPENWILGPQTVAIADLDGDGDMDLVSANYRSDNLTIFFQVNPGQFVIDPRGPLSPGSPTSPGTLAVGDLDGDGDPDVVCANEFSNTLTIFFGAH